MNKDIVPILDSRRIRYPEGKVAIASIALSYVHMPNC